MEEHAISGVSYSPIGAVEGFESLSAVQCDEPKASSKTYERLGAPTEAAVCVLTEKLGGKVTESTSTIVPPQQLASQSVNAWRLDHPRQATLEFNRDRKSMSVLASSGGAPMLNYGTAL